MRNIDLAYIIPLIFALISTIGILLYGKRKIENKSHLRLWRYMPILSVIGLLMGVFFISYYYENQILIEKQKFSVLQKANYYNDSILLTKKSKELTLDSLKTLNEELVLILANIKKQEKITGENSNIKEKIQAKIEKTNQEIGAIESYNEIIDKPTFIEKGYITSGNTSNFIFYCPTDTLSEFIDLKLKFQDKTLIKKIAFIYLTVTEVKPNGENWLIFSQAYNPKDGVNAFKIRNYLIQKNIILEIGYFLTSEIKKPTPRFEKISCRSN